MLRGSINHVSITVGDLCAAMKFFTPFLEFLGYNIGQVIQDLDGQRLTVNILPGCAASRSISGKQSPSSPTIRSKSTKSVFITSPSTSRNARRSTRSTSW